MSDQDPRLEQLLQENAALKQRVAELTEAAEKLEDQVRQIQKMETIGLLAGGVAHDMNNVLGAVMGLASIMKVDSLTQTLSMDDLDGIINACRRGRDLTRQLLAFARKSRQRRRRIPVNELVEEVRRLLGRTIPKQIEVRTKLSDEPLEVEGDPGQLNQVLMNLCINAADSIEGEGSITLSTRARVLVSSDLMGDPRLKPGAYVCLSVTDTGSGMDDETLRSACKPFFTTKGRGEGTGLGLAMVFGAIKNHGGRLQISSARGKGTEVSIDLPELAVGSEALLARATEYPPPVLGTEKILLIDDEELILRTGKRLLELLGYTVVKASGGQRGLEIYEREGSDIALVLLDFAMPYPDGAETFRRLRELDPAVKVLLCSGYDRGPQIEAIIEAGAVGFVPKPFEIDALSDAVRQVLS